MHDSILATLNHQKKEKRKVIILYQDYNLTFSKEKKKWKSEKKIYK
jgi:hypothetical protein